ncbi:MAG: glycoside hydrolase family 2 protein [Gemmatimonadetes bacterium]|nr:glycoside hydrolase family 2 protein [Gemmatimonadota bacterium]
MGRRVPCPGCHRQVASATLLGLLAGGLAPARAAAQQAGVRQGAVPVAVAEAQPGRLDWPAITSVHRPWTRWWWPGSAVTDAGLTAALEAYRAAGLGGVEITPIYGVAGYERQFIDHLSPEWVARLEHTLREAERLGLGVDLATGTGWPFGGPTVGDVGGAKYLAHDTLRVRGGARVQLSVAKTQPPLLRAIGNRLQSAADSSAPALQRAGRGRITIEQLTDPIAATRDLQALAIEQVRFPKPLPLVALVARAPNDEEHVLTDRVRADGTLDWEAPPGEFTLHAFHQGWHGKMVERAAPGGEGLALDHFSTPALGAYLAHFDAAFAGHDLRGLRAFFNDSYEVDDAQGEANWTPALLEEFRARRGYDLVPYLPALFGTGDPDTCARVLSDYRETVSDLLLDDFTRPWAGWAGGHGALVRNQAHGSPANILDLYAASDIPETEGTDILRFRSATSAAHVTGKLLASAEAATWLGEHFQSSLADVKRAVDRYFLGGVNHIVYHGTAYSPADAPWPGWLFYAAVHFQPTDPQWPHFRALNEYVARAQSILQGGSPANDILLYLPVHDRWAVRGSSLLAHFDGSMAPFAGTTVADDAALLQRRGYTFDFISDRQLRATTAADGGLRAGGNRYRVVLVPGAQLMPPETMARLRALAGDGATVIFHRQLPADVPGRHELAARRTAVVRALAQLQFKSEPTSGVRRAALGNGAVLLGDSLEALLADAGVRREPLVDQGLQFVRRRGEWGTDYFIVNPTDTVIDNWVPIDNSDPGAALFDPTSGETGVARYLPRSRGEPGRRVHLRLDPGASIIVRTSRTPLAGQPFREWRYLAARPLTGTWQLRFVAGGPELPVAVQLTALKSWTDLGTEAGRAFSGTASYALEFDRPDLDGWNWRLDLGEVHESARVRLNGHDLGTLTGPTYRVTFTAALFRDRNLLEVEVANLAANRIAAMDRQHVPWKRFYNVNFPPNQRANAGPDGLFDASRWEPRVSGLLGPVTLTALTVY